MTINQATNAKPVTIGPRQIAIILLTLFTALVHLIALNISLGKIDPIFTLNGLGYLALLAAYFLPIPFLRAHHHQIRWIFMAFAAITIVAWLILGDKSWPAGALGYITKLDELVLIILLWLDGR